MRQVTYKFSERDNLRLEFYGNGWRLNLAEGLTVGAKAVGVHLSGGQKIVGSLVRSSKQIFSDSAGHGHSVTAEFGSDEYKLSFIWKLFVYYNRPDYALSFSAKNDGSTGLEIEDLFTIDGPVIAGMDNSDRCTVLNNGPGVDYVWDTRKIEPVTTHLSSGSQAEAYWSTALAVPSRGINLVIGMGDAPTAFPRFLFSREEAGVTLYGAAVQETENTYPYKGDKLADYPASGINPLLLESGHTIRSRFAFNCSDSIHTALDSYADYVRDYLSIEVRYGPVTGLWGDYACNPSFRVFDVSTVTRDRLLSVMDLLQEKLQKYGLTYIMFTLDIGMASENAPDDFDWRKALPEAVLKTVDVTHPEYRGGGKGYQLEDHFPEGIRSFTDEIYDRGFKAAFHYTLLTQVKSGPPEWDDAAARTAKRKFVDDWGFDYLYAGSGMHPCNSRRDQTIVEAFGRRLKRVREEVGPDVFVLADTAALSSALGLADGARGARDFRGGNERLLLHAMARRYYYHGKWFWLDSEFYDPAERPFFPGDYGDPTPVVSTLEKARSWISLHAIACWSLFVGGALERTSDERFFLLSRALPVYPGRGYPVDLLAEEEPLSIWALHVSHPRGGEHTVVGLFNWSETRGRTVSFKREDVLEDDAAYLLFDFWTKRFVGPLEGEHDVHLPPYCCQVLHVTKKQGDATLIGSDRHVTGTVAVERWHYAPEAGTLTGESHGPESTEHSIYFYLDDVEAVSSTEGCTAEMVQPHVLRLTVRFGQETTRMWKATLDKNILWQPPGA